jgi:hypothetical protein
VRRTEDGWLRKLSVNGVGLVFTTILLTATVALKFGAGGWVTLVITGAAIALCVAVRRHYDRVFASLKHLDAALLSATFQPELRAPEGVDPTAPTAVLMVGGFNGIGVHSLLSIPPAFPGYFKNVVFLEVGVVDSSRFKGRHELRNLEKQVKDDLAEYEKLAASLGLHAESRYRLGTDAVEELIDLCLETAKDYKRPTFFAGKLIFPKESFFARYLHNQTAAKVESELLLRGFHTMVLPIRVSAEAA